MYSSLWTADAPHHPDVSSRIKIWIHIQQLCNTKTSNKCLSGTSDGDSRIFTWTVNAQLVNSEHIQTAVNRFIEWVKKYPNVVLMAHNGRRFDFPVLMSALMKLGMAEYFCASVCGLLDSLVALKKKYTGMESYKQEDLVCVLLGTSYAAQNAVEDVRSLGQLFVHADLAIEEILPSTFVPASVYCQILFNI